MLNHLRSVPPLYSVEGLVRDSVGYLWIIRTFYKKWYPQQGKKTGIA
ncbi:hypothetical protein EDWATA_00413 [Edwardsiella tarda ATCC 23685]|uniref:Uncharacterized protein n=1 Tax=Edwardsiella tarda ATCC 23685 TaxID=500638 RepID=D4F132_EDWTA|nr:hypothetical protein EDWATA_00413 [Edwardsiella tarda ATCC 23685]